MFFDVIDRRYNKEGPNTMIFTRNTGPDKGKERLGHWRFLFDLDWLILID